MATRRVPSDLPDHFLAVAADGFEGLLVGGATRMAQPQGDVLGTGHVDPLGGRLPDLLGRVVEEAAGSEAIDRDGGRERNESEAR